MALFSREAQTNNTFFLLSAIHLMRGLVHRFFGTLAYLYYYEGNRKGCCIGNFVNVISKMRVLDEGNFIEVFSARY